MATPAPEPTEHYVFTRRLDAALADWMALPGGRGGLGGGLGRVTLSRTVAIVAFVTFLAVSPGTPSPLPDTRAAPDGARASGCHPTTPDLRLSKWGLAEASFWSSIAATADSEVRSSC